ncbi:MAG: thiamine phosphate synthase [bacterium]|nr:thiamine phosphate synthase [bacterium]
MSATAFCGLHVLADDDPRWPQDPVEQARAALEGGARVLQLRAKHATDREICDWARVIRTLASEAGARFVLNDRFDLALAVEADAVHLGQDDLAPGDLPAQARAQLAIGRSTHDVEQARTACEEPIDYLAYGPLFGTHSKDSPYAPRGLEALREIVKLAGKLPVVAIGGINASNLPSVLAAGARGVAVISAIAGAEKPEAATRELINDPAWRSR